MARIKPDLVAVGANIYTAAQKLDPGGELYDPSGYGVFDGTSFSAPLVSGAVALVKAARPGLTAAQYRSLVINNTGRISYVAGNAGHGAAGRRGHSGCKRGAARHGRDVAVFDQLRHRRRRRAPSRAVSPSATSERPPKHIRFPPSLPRSAPVPCSALRVR